MTTYIYTVYKITNNINKKIYIGVHKTTNSNDSYFGSGIAIKKSIKKYGKEQFSKSILFEYTNYNDAYIKESQIVNIDFISRSDTYNMKTGGNGNISLSQETKDKISNSKIGYNHSTQTKHKMSLSKQGNNHPFFNKQLSQIHKNKISKSSLGLNNHQFKGYYITPWGKFLNCIDASYSSPYSIGKSTIYSLCKNSDKIIILRSYNQNNYLKSLNKSPVGKSYREIGFDFEPI